MTIDEFAEQLAKDNQFKGCYIAVMPADETSTYLLEVEIDHATIAGTYDTNHEQNDNGLEQARAAADVLESILIEKNIAVYETREEWENSAEYYGDEDEDDED